MNKRLPKILYLFIQPEEVIAGRKLKANTFKNRFLKNLIFFTAYGVLFLVLYVVYALIAGKFDWKDLIVDIVCGIATDIVLSLILGLVEYQWAKHFGTAGFTLPPLDENSNEK